jgi:hypothetical protein
MRYLLIAIACLCINNLIFAQGSVRGKVLDSTTQKPLGLATVTVFKAADTALITYRLSTPEGEFRVPGLPLRLPLRVVISFSGYGVFRKEFTLNEETPLELGTIALAPAAEELDEVMVIAERPPVTVRRDTIEFNAASFKTLPTALVEDLLRKLPGVQVDRDGNIMANGRRVNRIMVDGKSFFGDDPKMATRNLPANVIDRVQLTDDKDEINRNTDGDLTNVGQVINLTLRKGVKKGWFGKAYGGAGTDDRYEIGGIANIYRDTMQLSVLGFSNNVNRSGFSMKDVQDLGGFNRSGYNSMMISRRGGQEGFAINNINFGGTEAGIARSSGGGFNLNHAPSKRKTFFLQYFLGNTHNRVEELTNTDQFISDTTITTRTLAETIRNNTTHNLGAGANLKPDSLTDINFRLAYSYIASSEDVRSSIGVGNNKVGPASSGNTNLFNKYFNNNYYHSLTVTRRSGKKKGRSLNIYQYTNYANNLQRYVTESDLDYYYPDTTTRLFEQLRRQDVPNLRVNSTATFAQPLNPKSTLRLSGGHEYISDEQEVTLFGKNGATDKYDLGYSSRSSGYTRTQHRFNTNASVSYRIKAVNITAGVNALWQNIDNHFYSVAHPVVMNYFNVLPSFALTWKQMSLNYNQNVNAPSTAYLIPIPDSTNPFFIRLGNPYLRPARSKNFSINNYKYIAGSGTNINMYISGGLTDDDVVMSRTIDAKGVTRSIPVNVDGSSRLNVSVGYGREFKRNTKFIFNFRVSPYFYVDRRKMIVNNITSTVQNMQYGPYVSVGLNWNDVVELRPEYRPGVTRTRYSDPSFTNLNVTTHNLESELIIRLPKRFVWESNVVYRYNSQVAPGLPKDNVLWNAGLTFLTNKDGKGLLKLSVFDILNRNNAFYRYAALNQVIDTQTNVLQRYFLLSFTYNIRNMATPKKVGGRERLFMF